MLGSIILIIIIICFLTLPFPMDFVQGRDLALALPRLSAELAHRVSLVDVLHGEDVVRREDDIERPQLLEIDRPVGTVVHVDRHRETFSNVERHLLFPVGQDRKRAHDESSVFVRRRNFSGNGNCCWCHC